jgi:hypothetical protein
MKRKAVAFSGKQYYSLQQLVCKQNCARRQRSTIRLVSQAINQEFLRTVPRTDTRDMTQKWTQGRLNTGYSPYDAAEARLCVERI